MPRITMELLRRRSEHNEGEISTLEELSLHQENIERIELLNQACRHVKILLLQYNLISKIENLHKLKQLEYLNLALNNIEVIENLEGLESLKKLDLTVNFIGDIRGVKTLRNNEHLEQLILTGNPCCDYEGYREYVIATLPQLRELDLTQIERSERIKALQRYAEVTGDVIRGYRRQLEIREGQKRNFNERERQRQEERVKITEIRDGEEEKKDDSDEENSKFWNSPSYHTPEDRVAIAKRTLERIEKNENKSKEEKEPKKPPKLFTPDGRPYNVNQPKLPFKLNDEDDLENVILEVKVFKYLDTSLVDVDVQPEYVRVTVKGKVLQLSLPCEVATDRSFAQRNTATGSLLVTMRRLKARVASVGGPSMEERKKRSNVTTIRAAPEVSKREFLEIGPPNEELGELLKFVGKKRERKREEFVDDPSVPPLE